MSPRKKREPDPEPEVREDENPADPGEREEGHAPASDSDDQDDDREPASDPEEEKEREAAAFVLSMRSGTREHLLDSGLTDEDFEVSERCLRARIPVGKATEYAALVLGMKANTRIVSKKIIPVTARGLALYIEAMIEGRPELATTRVLQILDRVNGRARRLVETHLEVLIADEKQAAESGEE